MSRLQSSQSPTQSSVTSDHRQDKHRRKLQANKSALLEVLSSAIERYDKGTIDQALFGQVLERLQLFLEAEAEAEALSPTTAAPHGESDRRHAVRRHAVMRR